MAVRRRLCVEIDYGISVCSHSVRRMGCCHSAPLSRHRPGVPGWTEGYCPRFYSTLTVRDTSVACLGPRLGHRSASSPYPANSQRRPGVAVGADPGPHALGPCLKEPRQVGKVVPQTSLTVAISVGARAGGEVIDAPGP